MPVAWFALPYSVSCVFPPVLPSYNLYRTGGVEWGRHGLFCFMHIWGKIIHYIQFCISHRLFSSKVNFSENNTFVELSLIGETVPSGRLAFLGTLSTLFRLATGRPHANDVSILSMGFHCGSVSKEVACNEGDLGWIPGLGRSPEGGHGNPLQYSCLENPHGQRSLAGYSPWSHKESDTTERLNSEQHIVSLYSL